MENKLKFRKAKLKDIDRILELISQRIVWMDKENIHQWNETDYLNVYPRKYFEKNINYFLVAEIDNLIIAATALYKNDPRWNTQANALYVHHLVADINYKGAGIMLLKYLEKYAKENDYKFLRLDSAVGNKKLEDMYTKLGYQPAGTCFDGAYQGILREKKL